jgi:hypothetical protein
MACHGVCSVVFVFVCGRAPPPSAGTPPAMAGAAQQPAALRQAAARLPTAPTTAVPFTLCFRPASACLLLPFPSGAPLPSRAATRRATRVARTHFAPELREAPASCPARRLSNSSTQPLSRLSVLAAATATPAGWHAPCFCGAQRPRVDATGGPRIDDPPPPPPPAPPEEMCGRRPPPAHQPSRSPPNPTGCAKYLLPSKQEY